MFLLLLHYTRRAWPAAAGAGVILLSPDLLAISAGGMESFLFTSLIVGALLAVNRGRAFLAGALLGLACLTRVEGFLAAPLIVVALGWRNWKRWVPAGLIAATPLIAWIVFASFYYGTPVPQSILAKAKPIYQLNAGTCLVDTARHFGAYVTGWRLVRFQDVWGALAVGLVIVSGIVTVMRSDARRAHAYQPAAICLALLAFYAVGNPMAFAWYWPPITMFGLLAILLALWMLPWRSRGGRVAVAIACAGWFALILLPRAPGAQVRAAWAAVEADTSRRRISGYETAAHRLNEIAAGQAVASPEIGALGFYYRGKILDSCGLVSPEALPYLPVPRHAQSNPRVGAISVEFTAALRPPWVVTLRCFAERSLLANEWFAREYELVEAVPLEVTFSGSDHVLIYRRREDGRFYRM